MSNNNEIGSKMTPEQEAQQAQTIAEIKAAHNAAVVTLNTVGREPLGISAHLDRGSLIKIVDSQAQKIAGLNRVGSSTLMALIEAQEKIAEQAKEIKRLKSGGLIKPGSYRRLIRNLRNAKP